MSSSLARIIPIFLGVLIFTPAASQAPRPKAGLNRAKVPVPTATTASIHVTISGTQPAKKWENKEQIYLDFAPGGKIQGGGTHGLTFKNCKGIKITGPPDGYGLITGYGGRGIYLQNCQGIIISRIHIDKCGQDQNQYGGPPGLLAAQCTGLIIEWSRFSRNGTHGVYIGDSCKDFEVSDCEMWENRSCGVQVNAVSADHPPGSQPHNDGWAANFWVVRNKLDRNGSLGTGGFNFMSTKQGQVYDNWIRRAQNGIALSNNTVSGRGASGLHLHGNLVEALQKPWFTATSDSGTKERPNGIRDEVGMSGKKATPSKYCVDEGGNARYASISAAQAAGAVPKAFVDMRLGN